MTAAAAFQRSGPLQGSASFSFSTTTRSNDLHVWLLTVERGPINGMNFAARRADGGIVEPTSLGYGKYFFPNVGTRAMLEFPEKGVNVDPFELKLEDADCTFMTLAFDPGTGTVKEYTTKPLYFAQNNFRGRGLVNPFGPPANDDCANASPVGDGTTAISTIGATTDGPSDATCQFDGQTYNDVWFTYTASCTGVVTVSTCNTVDYDSDISIYDGTDCTALSLLACNDDGAGCAGFSSELTAPVTSGSSYLIRVGGFADGDTGSGDLNITCTGASDNDECDGASLIDCNSTADFDTSAATNNASDPAFSCKFGGPGNGVGSVWFKFTATDTSAFLDTNQSLGTDDTLIGVYDGTCGALTEIACSEDEGDGLLSEVCVDGLTIGNTYYVQVASFSAGDVGDGVLNLECPCPAPPEPPANDDCDDAQALVVPSSVTVDNTLATTDNEGLDCGVASGPWLNVWYVVTGTGNTMTVTTCNAGTVVTDTKISVFCGTCDDLFCVDGNDDDCPAVGPIFASTVDWCSTAGVDYYISVGNFSEFTTPGVIQVDISDNGSPCAGGVDCVFVPDGACCFSDGSCQVLTADDCAAAGGIYQGDDTNCGSGTEFVADGGFEGGSPNASWSEFSLVFGTPLCTTGGCGFGGGTGPDTGLWWAWFGGVGALETGTVSQNITIPASATNLTFRLEIPVSSGSGLDFLDVRIDGTDVATYTDADGPYVGYTTESVDITGFADGGVHTLTFDSTTTGAGGFFTNFFVDNASVQGEAVNPCEPECIEFVLGFEEFGNGDEVNGSGSAAISGSGLNYGTAAFDSNPAGPNSGSNDPDLLVDQGMILILQDQRDQTVPGTFDDPGDANAGGTMTFSWASGVEVRALDLIDIDLPVPVQDATVTLTDGSGNQRVYDVPQGWTADGGVQTLDTTTLGPQPGLGSVATATEDAGFDPSNVVSMDVFVSSSAGVDNVVYCEVID